MAPVLMIVGQDEPLYEADFASAVAGTQGGSAKDEEGSHLHQPVVLQQEESGH